LKHKTDKNNPYTLKVYELKSECYFTDQDRSSNVRDRICYVDGKCAQMMAGNHFQQLLWYEVSKVVLLVTFLEYGWNLQTDRLAYWRAAEHHQRLLLRRGNYHVAE